jgi:hypothetical protein
MGRFAPTIAQTADSAIDPPMAGERPGIRPVVREEFLRRMTNIDRNE